jgi:serine/threonine protein kinase
MGSLLDAARSFYRIGSYDRAIETLQSIPEGSPPSREAKTLLARIFVEKGLLQRALDCLKSIAPSSAERKEDAELLFALADAHERAGDLAQAAEILQGIVERHPDHTVAADRLEALLRRTAGDPTGLAAVRDQRYELRGEIGRGGMGVVYLAHDRELGRPVAIKFLPDTLAGEPRSLEMFRTEARASGALNHPNIIHVYDAGTIAGRPCIVMEYVPGRSVRELMKIPKSQLKRPLSPRRVAEIAKVIAEALHYAHGRNVIHRDVKPSNILISETDQPKLMDFGISKILESPPENPTHAKGTPQYMAPEQILGRPIDGRVDVYALGISMFEMLTGRRPFVGEDVVSQQLYHPLPDPRRLRPDVPEGLVRIIERACQKKAEARYPSAGEMAEALRLFVEGTAPARPATA